jgi:hypothetical protein
MPKSFMTDRSARADLARTFFRICDNVPATYAFSPGGRRHPVVRAMMEATAAMEMTMITGMHAVVYTRNAEADRAFSGTCQAAAVSGFTSRITQQLIGRATRYVAKRALGGRDVWIDQHGNANGPGHQLVQKCQPLLTLSRRSARSSNR